MSAEIYFDRLKQDSAFCENREKEGECLKRYNENADGVLDPKEFHQLCQDLFVTDGESIPLDQTDSRQIFDQLDEDKDGKLDKNEFHIMWRYWLPMVLTPKTALIVVDVQNDFISGSLAVATTEEIVPVINEVLDTVTFNHVFYSYDWHPEDHVSFYENLALRDLHSSSKVKKEDAKLFETVVFDGPVPTEQTLWPSHCVQHSDGAKLHKDLKVVENHTDIYKGISNHIDSYSAFFDNKKLSQTKLTKELCSRRITDVYVCGIATDVCVRHTALDATQLGFRTFLMEDAMRAITEEGCKKTKEELTEAGCLFLPSSKVKSMATATTRNPKMALKAARNVAEARVKVKDRLPAKGNNNTEKTVLAPVNASENTTLLDL